MMIRTITTLACTLILASAAVAEVKVTPLSIEEHRSRAINKVEGERFNRGDGGRLSIKLILGGPEIESATHYGDVKFARAVDDTGASIIPETQIRIGRDGFEELNRKHMWFFNDNPPKDKIKVDVHLDPASRQAKKLTAVEGTLTLRTTETQDVLAAPAAGKKITDKLLTDAGVTVTIKKIDAAGGSVQLVIEDPNEKVGDVDLVDASGKSVKFSRSSFGFNDRSTVTLGSDGALPAGVKVKIPIATNVTNMTVPFKLENVELP